MANRGIPTGYGTGNAQATPHTITHTIQEGSIQPCARAIITLGSGVFGFCVGILTDVVVQGMNDGNHPVAALPAIGIGIGCCAAAAAIAYGATDSRMKALASSCCHFLRDKMRNAEQNDRLELGLVRR